jgi:hypothetical protein
MQTKAVKKSPKKPAKSNPYGPSILVIHGALMKYSQASTRRAVMFGNKEELGEPDAPGHFLWIASHS